MWHDITTNSLVEAVVTPPIRKGECRVFARFPFKFSQLPSFFIKRTPRWYSHIGQNGVLEDDQLFLQGAISGSQVAALSLRKRFFANACRLFRFCIAKVGE